MTEVRDPRREFAEWLHGELVARYANETEAWATERVERVTARLNAARPDGEPKTGVILWLPELIGFSAFTTIGPYVYIGRRLLERLPSDETVAFILGHEIAHHDCGHLALFGGWADWLPRSSATAWIAALTALIEYRAYGAEKEAQADLYGIQLCLDAGYHGERCIQALKTMEYLSLDVGDIDGVYGPENLLDPTDPARGSVSYQIQRWLWTRRRGYLPLRERWERAREFLARGAAASR